jgi:sodium/potassium-transporting ATPase subunit alpha
MKAEEGLSDDNPQKGSTLRSWLLKRDVVFARTSPEQKLIIVDACQKLSHIVAVTGDGVNDTPAIKKADIGIAMGLGGSEVAKDAADVVLMDDNFANIVMAIKQGRLVFDILQKVIRYNLCSNICELLPFLGFVILQIPLPITIIFLLLIDIGTNVYPNVCFAYLCPEGNLMKRLPRNAKTDRLCTIKLYAYAYLFVGFIQGSACFLTYFSVFYDYGFKIQNLFLFTKRLGIMPDPSDVYNPYDQFNGNSNAFIVANFNILGISGEAADLFANSKPMVYHYDTDAYLGVDLRVFFYDTDESFWGICRFNSIGLMYNGPVCYRGEAIRYAQTGYLLSLVIMQVVNAMCSRTKLSSVLKHDLRSTPLNTSILVQLAIICMILYIPSLNVAFGTRPLLFYHWVPPLGIFILFFFYEEFTKYLIRNVKNPDSTPGWPYKYLYY